MLTAFALSTNKGLRDLLGITTGGFLRYRQATLPRHLSGISPHERPKHQRSGALQEVMLRQRAIFDGESAYTFGVYLRNEFARDEHACCGKTVQTSVTAAARYGNDPMFDVDHM